MTRFPLPGFVSRYRSRRRVRRTDSVFWGLIHDHNWLQYDAPRADVPRAR